MTSEIYEHSSIVAAHLAVDICDAEDLNALCETPVDLAIIAHKKRYVKQKLFGKMLDHLVANKYLEKQGEIYSLMEKWRRSLPPLSVSLGVLREQGIYQIYPFMQTLAKNFIDIIKNDISKLELQKLIYYIDSIDSSKGLHKIRSEIISIANINNAVQSILDINFGMGHSAIQLANTFAKKTVYSLQLNPLFSEAFEYTIQKTQKKNLFYSTKYPSELLQKLRGEKVDAIFLFNPLGFETPELEKILTIANHVSHDGTKLLLQVPFTKKPTETLLAEWLAECIEVVDTYHNFDYYNVALSNNKFTITKSGSNYLLATFDSSL
ncbi:MAG: class I SAM-dependent methyltransferase [Candidatus Heimdallarchaeota archaeon]|nr:class I SAM-dependent methyltransferase [Candidatus Heimdallarchaeota archaeon]